MDLSSLSNFISGLSGQAASWYGGITGTPVVTPALNSAQALQEQLAIQQRGQLLLQQQNPTLGAIFSSPTTLLVILLGLGAVFVLLFVFVIKK